MQKSDKEEHNNRVYIGRMSVRLGKFRCENYINEFNRCRNRASKLVIIQEEHPQRQEEEKDKTPSHHQRAWICDDCFKVKFSNDDKFTDQLLQVIDLSKNNKNDID
jgi:hypothetical protein